MPIPEKKSAQDRYSNNNVAHTTTWLFLFRREEIDRNFKDARDMAVKQFAFFIKNQTDDGRSADAEFLAAEIDKHLRKKAAAIYESSCTRAKAVSAMAEVLRGGENIFCQLAAQVDDMYKFPSEA